MELNAYLARAAVFVKNVTQDVDAQMAAWPRRDFEPHEIHALAFMARAYHYFEAANGLYPNYAEPCAGLCRVVLETTDRLIYHIRFHKDDNYNPQRTWDIKHVTIRRALSDDTMYGRYYGDLSEALHGGRSDFYWLDGMPFASHTKHPAAILFAMLRMVDTAQRLAHASALATECLGQPLVIQHAFWNRTAFTLLTMSRPVLEGIVGHPVPTYGELRSQTNTADGSTERLDGKEQTT